MKSKKEIIKLENEFRDLIRPRMVSSDDIKHVEERGAEIIRDLIDDQVVKELIKIAENEK